MATIEDHPQPTPPDSSHRPTDTDEIPRWGHGPDSARPLSDHSKSEHEADEPTIELNDDDLDVGNEAEIDPNDHVDSIVIDPRATYINAIEKNIIISDLKSLYKKFNQAGKQGSGGKKYVRLGKQNLGPIINALEEDIEENNRLAKFLNKGRYEEGSALNDPAVRAAAIEQHNEDYAKIVDLRDRIMPAVDQIAKTQSLQRQVVEGRIAGGHTKGLTDERLASLTARSHEAKASRKGEYVEAELPSNPEDLPPELRTQDARYIINDLRARLAEATNTELGRMRADGQTIEAQTLAGIRGRLLHRFISGHFYKLEGGDKLNMTEPHNRSLIAQLLNLADTEFQEMVPPLSDEELYLRTYRGRVKKEKVSRNKEASGPSTADGAKTEEIPVTEETETETTAWDEMLKPENIANLRSICEKAIQERVKNGMNRQQAEREVLQAYLYPYLYGKTKAELTDDELKKMPKDVLRRFREEFFHPSTESTKADEEAAAWAEHEAKTSTEESDEVKRRKSFGDAMNSPYEDFLRAKGFTEFGDTAAAVSFMVNLSPEDRQTAFTLLTDEVPGAGVFTSENNRFGLRDVMGDSYDLVFQPGRTVDEETSALKSFLETAPPELGEQIRAKLRKARDGLLKDAGINPEAQIPDMSNWTYQQRYNYANEIYGGNIPDDLKDRLEIIKRIELAEKYKLDVHTSEEAVNLADKIFTQLKKEAKELRKQQPDIENKAIKRKLQSKYHSKSETDDDAREAIRQLTNGELVDQITESTSTV